MVLNLKKADLIAILILLMFLIAYIALNVYVEYLRKKEATVTIKIEEGMAIGFVCPDFSYPMVRYLLSKANKTIDIMVYEFYHEAILNVLEERAKSGVRIRVLLENNTYGKSGDEWNAAFAHKLYNLANQGLPIYVRFDSHPHYLHAKVIIIDELISIILSDNLLPNSFPPEYGVAYKSPYSTLSRGWGVAIINRTIAENLTNIFNSLFSKGIDYRPNTREEEAPPVKGTENFEPQFKYVVTDIEHSPIRILVSPNNSLAGMLSLINSAEKSIFIEAMYIHYDDESVAMLIDAIKNRTEKGVNAIAIVEDDYPGNYDDAKEALIDYGIEVKPAFRKYSLYFLHNKGIIVDNSTVLIGSINWSDESITRNIEVGVIIENKELATFFLQVFLWDLERS